MKERDREEKRIAKACRGRCVREKQSFFGEVSGRSKKYVREYTAASSVNVVRTRPSKSFIAPQCRHVRVPPADSENLPAISGICWRME